MTFREFYDGRRHMPVQYGVSALGFDAGFFDGYDEVILFEDGAAFMAATAGPKPVYWTIIGRDEHRSPSAEHIARHVYFDHWVFECAEHNEPFLITFYNEWLKWQELPPACALEIQVGADLTAYQRTWLEDFSSLWVRVVEDAIALP